MNPTARSFLLLGAIGLLVFGVVCLKKRFQPEPLPPAFLPGDARGSQSSADATKSPTPTILSAQPGTEHYIAEPNLRQEVHPLPLDEVIVPPGNFPVESSAPTPVQPLSQEPQAAAPELPRWNELESPGAVELLPPVAVPNEPSFVPVVEPIAMTVESPPSPAPPTSSASDVIAASATSPANTVDSAIDVYPTTTTVPAPSGVVSTTANDSFWLISERVYGTGDYFKALYLLNRQLAPQPDRLATGIELLTPPVDELRRRFPEVCPL